MNPGDTIWKDPDTGAYWHFQACSSKTLLNDPAAFYRDVLDFALMPGVARSRCRPDGSVVHDVVSPEVAEAEAAMMEGTGPSVVEHDRLRQLRRAFKAWRLALAPPDAGAAGSRVVQAKRGRPRTRFPSYTREPTDFNLFVRSVMPQVKEELPQADNRVRMARCAELWRLRATGEQ